MPIEIDSEYNMEHLKKGWAIWKYTHFIFSDIVNTFPVPTLSVLQLSLSMAEWEKKMHDHFRHKINAWHRLIKYDTSGVAAQYGIQQVEISAEL